jgi:hypothetical protein
MSTSIQILFLSLLVVSISITRAWADQEGSSSEELIADEYGTYHVVITDEEDRDAFLQLPAGAKVVFHDANELRESFRIAREAGRFEVLDSEVTPEELFKDSPPLNLDRVTESFDGTHNTHCGDGETVSSWWNRNTPARPGAHDGVEDHVYIIFQQNAHPWWNYILVRNWGSKCTMEAYLTYNTSGNTPHFGVYDWSCNTQGDCTGQAGVGPCSQNVSKNTLLNGYVANRSDGVHTFPVIYVVVNEFYVPSENATYPYNNEVWLYRFSTNTWTRVHQRYHNIRPLIGTSGQDRVMWFEYHYTFNGGPGCTGQTHPDFGFIDYNHCKSPDGKNGSCSWYKPTSGNSFVANDHSNPLTIRHVVPNYSFHVTKP